MWCGFAPSNLPSYRPTSGGFMDFLKQLRSDYVRVRAWMVNVGEWTEAEAADIGADIKTSIDARDVDMLVFWRDWFGYWADVVSSTETAMAAMYQRELDKLRPAERKVA